MKNLALLLCMVITLQATAQKPETDSKAPVPKYEVSLLAGRALYLEDFKVIGYPNVRFYYPTINVYRNFNRWQVGVGLSLQVLIPKKQSTMIVWHITPHILINRTLETKHFNFYAGVMGGYVRYNHSGMIGNGITGGVQTGVLYKLHKNIALNAELAGRVSEIKYHATYDVGPYNVSEYSLSEFFLPMRLGIRVRI